MQVGRSRILLHTAVPIAMACILSIAQSVLQAAPDSCRPCAIPCARPMDDEFRVETRQGEAVLPMVFTSIVRDSSWSAGRVRQSVRLKYIVDTVCRDTVMPIADVHALQLGLTLGKVPPLRVTVLPLREYERTQREEADYSWFEVGPLLGYAGPDESDTPTVGFDNVFFGAEALVAPFGQTFGRNLSVALGAGWFREGGRDRFAPIGHVRFSLATWRDEERTRYVPNACTFSCSDASADTVAPDSTYQLLYDLPVSDPAAYIAHETNSVRSPFRPYLFVEGGPIFDGEFEGAGPDPSVNPEDYSEWFAGVGLGVPIWDVISVSLQYRYLRLNLRTPCPECDDLYRVNTNNVHSALLRVAYRVEWSW